MVSGYCCGRGQALLHQRAQHPGTFGAQLHATEHTAAGSQDGAALPLPELQPGLRLLDTAARRGRGVGGWRGYDRPDRARRCGFTADDEAAGAAPAPQRGDGGTNRPLPILLAVTLGGSAVLLFAMASGHLKGTQATLGIVAALVQVALAIGVISRPSRPSSAPPWPPTSPSRSSGSPSKGPHSVSALTAGIGVALSGIAVVVGAALAIRPDLGSTWSSATSVFGSLLPVAVAGLTIGGLFGTTAALTHRPRPRPGRRPGGSAPPSWRCPRPSRCRARTRRHSRARGRQRRASSPRTPSGCRSTRRTRPP